MVLHDYRCPVHGLFDNWDAKCKHEGCLEEVTRLFLKPVGNVSQRTKGIDSTLRATAESFGMTNLRSAREGENQLGYLPKQIPLVADNVPKMPDNVKWGSHGNKSVQSVCGTGSMNIAQAKPSPIQAGVNLSAKTVISHSDPSIKRTPGGFIQ